MHIYFFVRGKFEQVELWKAHAQTSYWKFRRTNIQTGKEEILLVQGALRPSVFGSYEFVFPKESLTEVCSFFGIDGGECTSWGKLGVETRKFMLRMMFGCREIPKDVIEKSKKIPPTFSTLEYERGSANCVIPGVALHVIGIKDDVMGEIGGYKQEMV